MPTISEHDALPSGTRLGEFEIQQILGVGGFGIVYLAMDHALLRQVAIKEYMPAALASRGLGSEVVVRSAAHVDTFALGLRSFINEARLLARFDHPSLVKVYRFWEEHGTAYMVMPYYQGQTLLQVRRGMEGPPDEAWLRRLITPLLGALDCLHRENVYHRDIAPDNILLLDDEAGPARGRPVLLDLGAARKVIGDHTQALTAIVKPSFAPIEQYAETAQIRQGPWTDLYALAAVVHFCVTGRSPVPATARAVHDELPCLRQMREGLASGFDCHYSESFVDAIDHALAVRPQDRPESIAAWRGELSGIVSAASDTAAPKDGAWSPQTVLMRQGDREPPPGHQAVEAQAYMTTVPAAGKLNAAPTWPQAVPKAANDAGADTAGNMPPTMPVPAPSSSSLTAASMAGAPAPHPNQRTGLRWGFVVLALLTVMAVWWLQRVAHKARPAQTAMAATEPMGDARRHASADGAASTQPTDAESHDKTSRTVATSEDTRRRHQRTRQEPATSARKEDNSSTAMVDASDAMNPRKACAGKTFILLAICMKRHCSKPEYSAHPECERMRQQEAAQRPNY